MRNPVQGGPVQGECHHAWQFNILKHIKLIFIWLTSKIRNLIQKRSQKRDRNNTQCKNKVTDLHIYTNILADKKIISCTVNFTISALSQSSTTFTSTCILCFRNCQNEQKRSLEFTLSVFKCSVSTTFMDVPWQFCALPLDRLRHDPGAGLGNFRVKGFYMKFF